MAGNLLDPGATKDSPHHPFIEALEARGDLELGGAYDEMLKQDGSSWAALMDQDYPLAEARSEADPGGWGASRAAQQAPADVEHCYGVYGKNPSAKQKTAREGHLKSGKKNMPMANRRIVGLLKMIRNVAFAHRSQHVQAGRFETEEDVLSYMMNPFPWLLMVVYQLDQEHKIAGSVAEQAPAKTSDSAATTDGESTSREDPGKKSGKAATTSGDEQAKIKTSPSTKADPSTKSPLTREVRRCATIFNAYSAPTISLHSREGAVTGQECHELFEQLDTNSDGTLSQNEIKKGLAALKEATGLVQSAKQIFRGADANSDRVVDADEFYAYMAEQATQSEKDTKLAQKLGQLQPFMVVFLLECMGQLASFGPT